MPEVITLDDLSFTDACVRLEDMCRDYNPDLVIGIATGGAYVAGHILCSAAHASVVCRRKSTVRNPFYMRLVPFLPLCVRDQLRILQSNAVERRLSRCHPDLSFRLPDGLIRMVAKAKKVLVVDDAVDSGTTLATVLEAVRRVGGERELRSAAITITTSAPIARPDYTLFDNRTLIRFPWASNL